MQHSSDEDFEDSSSSSSCPPCYGCAPSWEFNAKSAGVKWRSTRFGSSFLGLGSVGKHVLASGNKFCGVMRKILFHSLKSMITFGHIVSMKKMSGSCSLLFTNGPNVEKIICILWQNCWTVLTDYCWIWSYQWLSGKQQKLYFLIAKCCNQQQKFKVLAADSLTVKEY